MNKNENRMFHSFSEALPARKGRGKAEKKQPFRNFALHKPHIAKFKRRCRRNETPKEKILSAFHQILSAFQCRCKGVAIRVNILSGYPTSLKCGFNARCSSVFLAEILRRQAQTQADIVSAHISGTLDITRRSFEFESSCIDERNAYIGGYVQAEDKGLEVI